MPIRFDVSRFKHWADSPWAPSLGIDSDQLRECLAETKRRKLKGVFGTNPAFRESSLDFLQQLPELSAVQFWDVSLEDISGLYGLNNLQYLRLSGKRPLLEFERLRTLKMLVWEHHKKDSGIGFLKELEFFHLWRYRASDKSAFELKLPDSLVELGIFWSNVETLDGLDCLPNLKKLEIARCRNLRCLGSLAEVCPNLEHLVVTASGRLTAKEAKSACAGLPKLRHFFAANTLLLSSRGQ